LHTLLWKIREIFPVQGNNALWWRS
jgi:hypothetical protein